MADRRLMLAGPRPVLALIELTLEGLSVQGPSSDTSLFLKHRQHCHHSLPRVSPPLAQFGVQEYMDADRMLQLKCEGSVRVGHCYLGRDFVLVLQSERSLTYHPSLAKYTHSCLADLIDAVISLAGRPLLTCRRKSRRLDESCILTADGGQVE